MIKSRLQKDRNGYTLIELILVMVVIGVLTVSAVSGILRSRRVLTFNAADQQVGSLVREARSLAVTGKAIPDYADYDNDNCRNAGNHLGGCALAATENDYVTPANYGVHFDVGNNMLILFADLDNSANVGAYDNSGNFGQYIAGQDLKIGEYEVDPSLLLLAEGSNGTSANTVMFSPIFADVSFSNTAVAATLTNEFFVFGLRETSGAVLRDNCLAIHPIAGVPETTDTTGTACP